MDADDILYFQLMIFALLIGPAVRYVPKGLSRKIVTSVIGFSLVALVSRYHFIHSAVTILVNAAITSYLSYRICHIASFVWCFGYLAFFRCAHLFGLPTHPPHCNAVHLLVTLKMVSAAFERHDTVVAAASRAPDDLNRNQVRGGDKAERCCPPTFWDIVFYGYCYVGVTTGPFYKLSTWRDFLHSDHVTHAPLLMPALRRLKFVPISIVAFLLVNSRFPLKYVLTEDFSVQPLWYKMCYLAPLNIAFRTRFYIGFLISEATCITAGVGAYPVAWKSRPGLGPTQYTALEEPAQAEYDYETVYNLDVMFVEKTPFFREGMKQWNQTVQWWMAHYVYRRIPGSRFMRTTITLIVSAFWHGVHPGYYLGFLSSPPHMAAEALYQSKLRPQLSATRRSYVDSVFWFMKVRIFESWTVAFLLRESRLIFAFWSSLYFMSHLPSFLLVLIVYVWAAFVPSPPRENGEASSRKVGERIKVE